MCRNTLPRGNSTSSMIGVAYPRTFLLDSQGRVKSRSFEESYRERTTTANVLPHLGAIQALVTTRVPRPHSCVAIKLFCLKNVSVHKTL
jgi:hypothetical protein